MCIRDSLYTAYNPEMAIREVGFSRKLIAANGGLEGTLEESGTDTNGVLSEGDEAGPTRRSLPKFGSIRKRNRQSKPTEPTAPVVPE